MSWEMVGLDCLTVRDGEEGASEVGADAGSCRALSVEAFSWGTVVEGADICWRMDQTE